MLRAETEVQEKLAQLDWRRTVRIVWPKDLY